MNCEKEAKNCAILSLRCSDKIQDMVLNTKFQCRPSNTFLDTPLLGSWSSEKVCLTLILLGLVYLCNDSTWIPVKYV